MSVADVDKIDMIATRPDANQVRLVIADHMDWSDTEAHLLLLQEKFNTYLAFVESGELLQQPDVDEDADVTVYLRLAHGPPADGVAFLEQIRLLLEEVGIQLLVEWQ